MGDRNKISTVPDWEAIRQSRAKRENRILVTSNEMIIQAAQTATHHHYGQYRKYGTKLPYIFHPMRVAGLVTLYQDTIPEMVSAAWLHDTLEDTDYSEIDLFNTFGQDVYQMVLDVTNPSKNSDANRETRKKIDRDHIAQISEGAKLIKLADRIDNLQDMTKAPTDFIRLYLRESQLLLDEALRGIDGSYEYMYENAMQALERIVDWRENYGPEARERKRNRQ